MSQNAHEIARPSVAIGGSTITILYSAPQLEHLNSIGPSFFISHAVSRFVIGKSLASYRIVFSELIR